MTLAAAIILFLNAAFNVIAWPRFFVRVVRDPRARDARLPLLAHNMPAL
jgi:hypothetical protein